MAVVYRVPAKLPDTPAVLVLPAFCEAKRKKTAEKQYSKEKIPDSLPIGRSVCQVTDHL